MSVESDLIRTALRRRRRWILAFSFGPPLVAFVVPCVALSTKFFARYGELGSVLVAGLSWVPVTLATVIALVFGFGRGTAAAYWPSLCGAIGAAAGLFLGSIGTEGSYALVVGWDFACKLGAGGALFGFGLSWLPVLQFRLPCEQALDALRCNVCGRSLAGFGSCVCSNPTRLLCRRLHKWIVVAAVSPFPVAFIIPPAAMAMARARLGYGEPFLLTWLGASVWACAPVVLVATLSWLWGIRRGVHAAFWSASCGSLGAIMVLTFAAWQADSKSAGIRAGWLMSFVLGAGGVLIGALLASIPRLQFRVSCERALDALRCRRCGYSFAGLESPLCPECGARRPPA